MGREEAPRAPGRPRSEQCHLKALEAAADLLEELPYAAVTIEGIAERAGCSKQTLYKWWKSRPALIMEAYAAGVPVLASNSGGIAEILTDGETGFLVPTGDPVRLAAKIRDLLKQPALLKQVAANARTAWSERYTVPHYQARVLSILDRIGPIARA